MDDEPPFVPTSTWYVSPSGDDGAGDGSMSRPWRSLAKATSSVKSAGALIRLLAGTYTETQTSQLAEGVSIEGEGESTVIQSTLTADWTPIISAASTAEGTAGDQHIAHLKLDGQALKTFWAVHVVGRSNVSIYDCTIVDFLDRGVIFDGRTDNQPGPPKVFATQNRFHHNIVHNCAAYDTPNGKYGRGALNIGGQDGMVIHHNTITQTERPSGFNGWPIKYSLDGYLKGVKIHDNVLTKNVYVGTYPGDNDWDFAVELWNGLGGNEIYGNTIEGAIDLVISKKTSYANAYWIHDNVLSQPSLNAQTQDGIIFEQSVEGVVVENNVMNNLAVGVVFFLEYFDPGPTENHLTDITIRHNLLSNIGRNIGNMNNGCGIGFFDGAKVTFDVTNVAIYNNTVVAAPGNAPWEGIHFGTGNGTGTFTNVAVKNNIVAGGFQDAWLQIGAGGTFQGLTVQNNDSFGNLRDNAENIVGTPSGYTKMGNLAVDPMFVSATDFHLRPGSPLIDAGVNVGLPFTGSAPDIGYAER